MSDLRKKFTEMKVAELRAELDKLGLEKHGVKMMLVERLLKHYETSTESKETAPATISDDADTQIITADVDDADDVVVDEDIDATNDEQDVEGGDVEGGDGDGDVEGGEEEHYDEHQDENEQYDETYAENENEEVTDVVDENGVEGDHEVCYENGDEAETETSVVGETVEDEENDGDGDALNISVEENEVLGIEQDEKIEEDIHETEDSADLTAEGSQADEQDESNNTSTTGKNEAEADSKAAEGESEEKDSTGKESERHIILVTGLSSDTSANDLKTFFRKYGKIGRIKIMTNTRVPGSQRFAHISVPSLDELKYLVDKLNGVQLKGKSIRVAKAPEDGSVSRSYEIAVATAKAEADGTEDSTKNDGGKTVESNDSSTGNEENGKGPEESDAGQANKESEKETGKKNGEKEKKTDAEKKKDDKKEPVATEKKTPEKGARPDRGAVPHRSRRESHDRHRGEHVRPHRPPFRRDKDSTEWKRHGPPRGPMEVTRVHRDRPPMGRAPPPNQGGRRRSPHAAQLTFEQIREIRDEQRRREHERRKREEERERAAEVDRQKRLEYQNYMEFKQLEREREKLRLERERIEREKQDLIKLERERQKAEREKIEREKEELRRAKLNIDHQRSGPVKRPYEDDKLRRRDSDERKKPYVVERGRIDGKTEAERKMERERYERERIHTVHTPPETRSRSPFRPSGARESRRDVWDERDRSGVRVRTRSDERSHRRETEAEKVAAAERRSREAPSRGVGGSSDLLSRHAIESSHSSNRSIDVSKRPNDRYEEARTTSGREAEWMTRSAYLPQTSSLSLPMSASASVSRDSWPFTERKIEAWDTSRLAPRTEQWISGAGATVGTTGRSSLPVIAPPPPLYSSAAASLALPGSGLGLGDYSSERYDGYRGFHPIRKY